MRSGLTYIIPATFDGGQADLMSMLFERVIMMPPPHGLGISQSISTGILRIR